MKLLEGPDLMNKHTHNFDINICKEFSLLLLLIPQYSILTNPSLFINPDNFLPENWKILQFFWTFTSIFFIKIDINFKYE